VASVAHAVSGTEFTIAAAAAADASGIVTVLDANRHDPSLYLRSEPDVLGHSGEFIVARDAFGRIVGCAALHRDSAGLAEVLSVAVLPTAQGQGVGGRLVEACEKRARSQGVARLWLATLKPEYFARFGYRRISRWRLPAPVLLAKLALVVRQPPDRWRNALLGREVFMLLDVAPTPPAA
jgi:amino-acid N-acetyltransferase